MRQSISLIFAVLFGLTLYAQTNSTGVVTLSPSLGYTAQIDITSTTVTLTLDGPSTGYLGIGFDTFNMLTADKDCLIYLQDGVGINERLSDRSFNGNTSTPDEDSTAEQDWTIIENTVTGTMRHLVATRVPDTGNANDYVFTTNLSSLTIAWTYRAGTFNLGYHGDVNRGATTTSFTLSTQEFQAPTKFSIYPNPGNDVMNINLPSLSNDGLLIEVFNVLGKKIYSEGLSDLNTKIDISKWNSGLYLVHLTSPNEDIRLAKRFVKL